MKEQIKATTITIPYSPRPLQAEIHANLDTHRWSVVVLHRRAGKTVMLLNQLVKRAMQNTQLRPRFAYIAPFLKQAKTLSWDYLKYYCDPIPGRTFSESELRVELPNGAQIRLYGADNPDSLRGIYLDGCVLDEYAQIDPVLFSSIIRPALSDRKGWCVFSGTPNGKNHFFDVLQTARMAGTEDGWYSLVAPASQTGIVDPDELKDAKRTMTEEEFDREYECSFDSVLGKKIYTEFNYQLHVARESLIPQGPVTVIRGVDNTGLSPAWVLTYMTPTQQWRVFKEFCFKDTDIRDATEAVILWCQQNLHPKCKYIDYGDPAGAYRDTTKMTPKHYITMKAREMGQDIYIIDGIQTPDIRWSAVRGRFTRMYNGEPAILIDPDCKVLIEGFMGAYCFKEMVGTPGMFLKKADKTWHANVQDALQYPATRLFLSNEAVRAVEDAEDGLYYNNDVDFSGYSGYESKSGRSTIGGY